LAASQVKHGVVRPCCQLTLLRRSGLEDIDVYLLHSGDTTDPDVPEPVLTRCCGTLFGFLYEVYNVEVDNVPLLTSDNALSWNRFHSVSEEEQ
jgi:hypothetical protein